MDKKFSHLDNKGNARIVDISKKKKSSRYARAKATVWLSKKIITMIKNDKFQKEGTFYFILCPTKLIIYNKTGFYSYLDKNKGNIELSDLYLTNLNQNKDYCVERNQLVPSMKKLMKIDSEKNCNV